MPAESIDILAVLRAPLEQYPPSVYQLEILAEAGCRIVVVDTDHEHLGRWAFSSSSTVTRIHGGQHTLLYRGESPSTLSKLRRSITFYHAVARSIRRYQPRVVMAYDAYGFLMLGGSNRGGHRRIVVHFHDIPVYHSGDGLGAKLACEYAYRHSRHADLVIHPDRLRADYFGRVAGLRETPRVVMNCPRLLTKLPPNRLPEYIEPGTLAGNRIVYFHGWIGRSRKIDNVIRSMAFWPENAIFVLVGPIEESYKTELMAIAKPLGMEYRVRFIAPVEPRRLMEIAAGADVTCSLVQDESDVNWRLTAGAINKRFEYMALGKPQVTDNGEGVAALFQGVGCMEIVDPTSPEQIGRCIRALLENPERREELSKNARTAHLSEFNYERQFTPVKETVLGWLHA